MSTEQIHQIQLALELVPAFNTSFQILPENHLLLTFWIDEEDLEGKRDNLNQVEIFEQAIKYRGLNFSCTSIAFGESYISKHYLIY